MFEQDWMMRQIQMMVQIVAGLILGKEVAVYEIRDGEHLSSTDYLYKDLNALLDRGEIGKAEDLLFERLDKNNQDYLVLALDFYQRLNAYSDEELERANFSREEITSGLDDMMEAFGIPPLVL